MRWSCCCICLCFFLSVQCIPDQGKWDYKLTEAHGVLAIDKSLYKDSEIYIRVTCESNQDTQIKVQWALSEALCWGKYLSVEQPSMIADWQLKYLMREGSVKSKEYEYSCSDDIVLEEVTIAPASTVGKDQVFDNEEKKPSKRDVAGNSGSSNSVSTSTSITIKKQESSLGNPTGKKNPVFRIPKDGIYLLTVQVKSDSTFEALVHIEMKGMYGYLSAADWPLLPFYGIMCLVYVIFAVIWLIVSFLQWRDLLRIQFWIGAVIFLGMLEKALFYAEYENINVTGEFATKFSVLLAEWVSCAKRALARVLVIIVSIGFGILRPRLGSEMHKVIAVGAAYFVVAVWEAYLRVMEPRQSFRLLIASIPLAILDSFVCWWVFSSLVTTTRALRLRRNLVKLSLYNCFINTLALAVVASIIYMVYSIKTHRITNCLTDWKVLWIDDAFWHFLFSVMLLVIMILWRPTKNNQRYAFSPLLDAEDDDDDEEIEQFVNDSYGVKMRSTTMYRGDSPKHKISIDSVDDDLKWVEENIPPLLINTTVLDPDQEMINSKFEISKMQ